MERRKRNRLCIWLIFAGVVNLTVYTAVYAYIGGDAINGEVRAGEYYLRGHFLRRPAGLERPVSLGVWVYSYLHSMSIIPTCVGVILPLMVLARPHIIATMKEGSLIQGPTIITISMTLLIALAIVATLWFTLSLLRDLGG